MKRKITAILLVIALGLALVLPAAPAAAHMEGAPQTVDLIADGGSEATEIVVGSVSVWNDGTNLYVQYKITDLDWELVATHLDVVTSKDDFLTTKKTGNPKVGKFTWQREYDPTVQEDTYVIPGSELANWVPSTTNFYIAAHAEVIKETTIMVVSDTTSMVTAGNTAGPWPHAAVFAWEPGPNYPNDGPDDSAWQANSLWDKGLTGHTFSANADWIWESYRVVNPVAGDVVDFQKTFWIEGDPTAGGTLYITCDNGYEVFVNSASAGSAQVYGAWRTSNLTQSYVDTNFWQSVENPDILGKLQAGWNTISVDTANEEMTQGVDGHAANGTLSSNPAGLIFETEITSVREETAWGDGERFTPKGNWATFFTYHVQALMTLEDSGGDATAEWSTAEKHDGSYSVYLSVPTVDDYAEVYLSLPTSIELSAINLGTTSFWCKSTNGDYIPYFMFEMEGTYTGTADILRINNDAAPSAGYTTWAQFVASSATTPWQYQEIDTSDWSVKAEGWDSWANLVSTYGSEIVTAVLVENSGITLNDWGSYGISAYVDEITVNSVNYGPD